MYFDCIGTHSSVKVHMIGVSESEPQTSEFKGGISLIYFYMYMYNIYIYNLMSEKAIWLDIAQVCGCIFVSSRQVKIQYKDAYIIDIWKLSTCVHVAVPGRNQTLFHCIF